jgi:hypothetical protein
LDIQPKSKRKDKELFDHPAVLFELVPGTQDKWLLHLNDEELQFYKKVMPGIITPPTQVSNTVKITQIVLEILCKNDVLLIII